MTKDIHILNEKAIAVTVPEDQKYFDLYGGVDNTAVVYNIMTTPGAFKKVSIELPPGFTYSILGKGDGLDENQWKRVISPVKTFGYPSHGVIPQGAYQWFVYAKESGLSLLRSLSLNPEVTLILLKH
jgi:hypothetical protein